MHLPQWKMGRYSERLIYSMFLLLIYSIFSASEEILDDQEVQCPIGFVYFKETELCYQIKPFETSFQKYDRCNGNEVPLDFRNEYKTLFQANKNIVWTDYVRAYKNGPYINWRIGDKDMGQPVDFPIQNISQENMCVVVSIATNDKIAVNCESQHTRLCVVRPYVKARVMSWDGCPDEYQSFPSPIPTCLRVYAGNRTSIRRVGWRANWRVTLSYCDSINGFLPHRGYIYLNHGELGMRKNQDIPLGIITAANGSAWWTNYTKESNEISIYERKFDYQKTPLEIYESGGLVALHKKDNNYTWVLRNPTAVYNYAVCEYFVYLPTLQINFTNEEDSKLHIKVEPNTVVVEDLACFTDASKHYPVRVNISKDVSNDSFLIDPIGDGFYWCQSINTWQYISKKSVQKLFISNFDHLKYVFAIMIQFSDNTNTKLTEEYIKLILVSHFLSHSSPNTTADSKNHHHHHSSTMNPNTLPSLMKDITVKRIYDNKRALVHVTIYDTDVELKTDFVFFKIIYKRNVKSCMANDLLKEKDLGDSYEVRQECRIYYCAGNFNVGAFWKSYPLKDCTSPSVSTSVKTTLEPSSTEVEEPSSTDPDNPSTDDNSSTTSSTYPETSTETNPPTTTTMSPEDEIQNGLDSIEDILNHPVNESQLDNAANIISNILDIEDGVTIPSKILLNLDELVSRVNFSEQKFIIMKPNLAMAIAKTDKSSPVTGMAFKSGQDESLENGSFQVFTNGDDAPEGEDNDIVLNVPSEMSSNAEKRLSFVVFKNDRAFNQDDNIRNSINQPRVNTRVLSVSLSDVSVFENDQFIDIQFRPHESQNENQSKICAFWDFTLGKNGDWSGKGCQLIQGSGLTGLDTCRCNHLTHFAQLIVNKSGETSTSNGVTLTIISLIGCAFSLIGLLIIGLTGILFRSWRSDFNNKIWMHLSAAMTILIVTFIFIALFELKEGMETFCVVTGVLLHYSVLSSFCWMLISAVLSYQRLVTVFTRSSSHRLLKACVFGWIFPIIPIAVLFIFDPHNYSQHLVVEELKNSFCYPSDLGFWLTVFLPIALILAMNAVLFGLIVYSVFISSKIKRHGDTQQLFRSLTVSFLLFFLFGLTWVFGLFADNLIMSYLFCITATLQGLVLCIFFVLGNKKTRDLWLIQLNIKERKTIPATTSMSRSYPSRGNSKSGRLVSLRRFEDDCTTKPRSLSVTHDNNDSRFS